MLASTSHHCHARRYLTNHTNPTSCHAKRLVQQKSFTSMNTGCRRCIRAQAVVPPEQEDKGKTGVLEKPGFDRSQEDSQVLPDNFYGSTEQPPGIGLGGGDWRVMLLDSPTHTEPLVVRVLTQTVSSVDEQKAKNCFNTSKQLGQALIVSCLKEHAEFFTQMINRQGVRSVIEPDTTTL